MCHLFLSQTLPHSDRETGTIILAVIVIGVGIIMIATMRWMRAHSRALLKSHTRKPAVATPDPWTESARRLRPDEPPPADEVQEP